MTDILDLPDWTVTTKRLDGSEYELEAEFAGQPAACLKCGVVGRLYKHGTKVTTYRDSPIRGHPVRLLARVQRYRCRECGETFLQPLEGIGEDRRMTVRCAEYIKEQCLRDTFVRIAGDIGCDDKTVRTLAAEHIATQGADYHPILPEWLGIDETKIDGKMRCVITDVGAGRPVDMLADRDKVTVSGWLYRFKDRSHVKGVAIDMWRPYRDIVKALLPGVPVVIDKFHVVRMASYCMERVRIRLQKVKRAGERRDWLRSKALLNMRYARLNEKQRFNVDMWLDNEPQLAAAHRLKETFYGIYELSRVEAEVVYDRFARTVPADLKGDFKVLLTAMRNWRTEILAYFDHPISNAYTEALNGVAKTINRAGRGYSFEVLRARLLFGKPLPDLPPPSPTGPKPTTLPPTARLSPRERVGLLDAAGGRCMSCSGVFDRSELDIHQTLPLVPGERRKMMVVCRRCHQRFHTAELSKHYRSSTQKSG